MPLLEFATARGFSTMSRDDAVRAVLFAVDTCGRSRQDFADDAQINIGTLGDFLSGQRWPRASTLRKIEAELGWPAGRIDELRDAPDVQHKDATDVQSAIVADPDLLPEAKQSLLEVYGLLRRLREGTAPTQAAADRAALTTEGAAELRLVREMNEEPAPVKKAPKRPRPPVE